MPEEKDKTTKAPYHDIFLTGDELEPRSFFNDPISGDKTAEIWQELHARYAKNSGSLNPEEMALYSAITKRLTHENNVLEVKVSEASNDYAFIHIQGTPGFEKTKDWIEENKTEGAFNVFTKSLVIGLSSEEWNLLQKGFKAGRDFGKTLGK